MIVNMGANPGTREIHTWGEIWVLKVGGWVGAEMGKRDVYQEIWHFELLFPKVGPLGVNSYFFFCSLTFCSQSVVHNSVP